MSEQKKVDVVVIGGGQAGMSLSWNLVNAGVDHIVLESKTPCHTWKDERWDNFCLVTPNWQCELPGNPYQGKEPHGFMVKDQIVDYVDQFVSSFRSPVESGVSAKSLSKDDDGRFSVSTDKGDYVASQVVIATGAYHDPIVPPYASAISPEILQIHSRDYRNAGQLPAGAVLVVGSGQSGAQIAEDLLLEGREVHLCVGNAPRVARFYRGRDVVDWLADMKYYDLPVENHPLKEGVRDKTNHYVTGRDGGRDIDLRAFALEGMTLHGSLKDISRGYAVFASDLEENLDDADAVSESIKSTIDRYIDQQNIDAPEEARYTPVWKPQGTDGPLDLQKAGITSVIWCIGFRPDYRWIDIPVFNGRGQPAHYRGVTQQSGLYFLGLPWLHTWGSGRFSGIARDAAYIAEKIVAKIKSTTKAD